MALRRKLVVALFLSSACAASMAAPTPPDASTLTPSEYAAELDLLASTVHNLSRAEDVPPLLKTIPLVRRVQTSQTTFEISTQWLRAQLLDWQKKQDKELQERMVA